MCCTWVCSADKNLTLEVWHLENFGVIESETSFRLLAHDDTRPINPPGLPVVEAAPKKKTFWFYSPIVSQQPPTISLLGLGFNETSTTSSSSNIGKAVTPDKQKVGNIRAAKDIVIELGLFADVSSVLGYFPPLWQAQGKLILRAPKSVVKLSKSLELPCRLELMVKEFAVGSHTFSCLSLDLRAEKFTVTTGSVFATAGPLALTIGFPRWLYR